MARSIYSVKERNKIILYLSLGVGGFLLYASKGLFSAFLGAIVMYTIFRPFFVWMIEKKNLKTWLASGIVLLISFLIIVLPFTLITIMIFNKANSFLRHNEEGIFEYIEKVKSFIGIEFTDVQYFEKGISLIQDVFLNQLSGAVNEVLSILLTITILYFVLYFMIVNYKQFENTLLKFMPFNPSNSKIFAKELTNTTNSNVLGQGFIAVVQGTLVGLAFWFFGFKEPFFWAIISTLLSFLPVIGAPIVFVPAALVALSQGDKFGGYGMLIFGFGFITNIDNVLRFIIAEKFANIHPLITIIGVIIGFPIFGILGLVFGPLLISYFLILVKIYEKRKEVTINKLEIKQLKLKRQDSFTKSPPPEMSPHSGLDDQPES